FTRHWAVTPIERRLASGGSAEGRVALTNQGDASLWRSGGAESIAVLALLALLDALGVGRAPVLGGEPTLTAVVVGLRAILGGCHTGGAVGGAGVGVVVPRLARVVVVAARGVVVVIPPAPGAAPDGGEQGKGTEADQGKLH